MDGGSAEPSLAEIHQEMSELLDKQVNAQKEKIFRGSCKLPQAHEKVCDENEHPIRIPYTGYILGKSTYFMQYYPSPI